MADVTGNVKAGDERGGRTPEPAGEPAGRPYHHGDLPSVLTDTAIELIRQAGPHGFSLAEAARRAGVSISAPYRHFRDKEALLAAVGLRGYERLGPRLDAAAEQERDPASRLAAAAAAYVRFAVEERPFFAVLYESNITKARFPELGAASLRAFASWLSAARALTGGDEAKAVEVSIDVLAVAHGHAALLVDGQFGDSDEQVDQVARRTRGVVLAQLSGRAPAAGSDSEG